MILDEIVRYARAELENRRAHAPVAALRERPAFGAPRRNFAESLKGSGRRIIAEVKRASPSQGLIRADFDPVSIARAYARNGASALSVLTEERYFQGSLRYLEEIRNAVALPLLRKDFVFDPYQVVESRSYGADAVLLIAAILSLADLRALREQAESLDMHALVEVHTEDELERAVRSGARVIGINNRDLRSFKVDLTTTERLAPKAPPGTLLVCESGLETEAQLRRIERAGVSAFLIGETLMRAADPGARLKELLTCRTCP
ncbi:MAG TPA: indole-3-glycerol phosphate synthase TrpC [Candidatus Acidoferrales bacterium]|nr:indole-3-glycerol phosphate synthase TrpC [Candidatus Acidoferrales bacterium]